MTTINQTIDVNAYYFAGQNHLRSFPKQIIYNQQNHTFVDGMQYLIKHGANTIRLFDMTDGQSIFRLRNDGSSWTLIGTR